MYIGTEINTQFNIRNFNINNTGLSKVFERLATGLRINSAADSASGLSVSEKIKAQYRGLKQAKENAQQGINLIDTLDGSYSEIQNILKRIRDLAVQAANDTLTSKEREYISTEINQMYNEIDRISDTTEYNTKNLMKVESGPLELIDNGLRKKVVNTFSNGKIVNLTAGEEVTGLTHQKQQTYNSYSQTFSQIKAGYSRTEKKYSNSESFTTIEYTPLWKTDGTRIGFSTNYDALFYSIDPFASDDRTISDSNEFQSSSKTTHIFNGKEKRIFISGGEIYVRTDDDPDTDVKLTSSGHSASNPSFSPDGSKIAYKKGNDIYYFGFDPDLNEGKGGASTGDILVNTDNDVSVNQQWQLSQTPETYNYNPDALPDPKAIKVYKNGIIVPYDAVNGYTLAGDTLTLHGTEQMDGNDVLGVYYQKDYNTVNNPDGAVEIKLDNIPEWTDAVTPMVKVYLNDETNEIPFDITENNGWYFDGGEGSDTIKIVYDGGANDYRPDAVDTILVRYFTDIGIAPDSDRKIDINVAGYGRSEEYNLMAGDPIEKSIRVFKNDAAGEINYDAVNGYTYDSANQIITLSGNSRPGIDDAIYYTSFKDSNSPNDDNDGIVELKLSLNPEIYNLNFGDPDPESVKVEVDGVEKFWLDAGNGFKINNNVLELYGDARPDVNFNNTSKVQVWYSTDYNVAQDQDGVTEIKLNNVPENFGLSPVDINRSVRVFVGGAEINPDPTQTNGFTLNNDIISIYGSGRPKSTEKIDVYYLVDLNYDSSINTNQDGKVNITLPENPEIYSPPPSGSAQVYADGNLLGLSSDYNVSGNSISITPSNLIDADNTVATTVRYIKQDGNIFNINEAIEENENGNGSQIVRVDSKTLEKGIDYDIDYSTGRIELKDSARLVGYDTKSTAQLSDDTPHSIAIEYVEKNGNEFNLTTPDDFTGLIDEETIIVKVNDKIISRDDENGYSLEKEEKSDGSFNYKIKLNGNAKLTGNNNSSENGGNNIEVSYDFAAAKRIIDPIKIHVGANQNQIIGIALEEVTTTTLALKDNLTYTISQAEDLISRVDSALSKISRYRAVIGSKRNRLESASQYLSNSYLEHTGAYSRIVDADYSQETVELTRRQIIQQASISVIAQSNLSQQNILKLLQ